MNGCCKFFFFQAEDGIRDWSVTGVQTCLFRSAARFFWTIELLVAGVIAVVFTLIVSVALRRHDGVTHTIGTVAPWVVVAAAVLGVAVVPTVRAARWRWRL